MWSGPLTDSKAGKLFIHRNTLLYRLDRIAEILDLNYNDSEQMLTFQLALKAFLMCQ